MEAELAATRDRISLRRFQKAAQHVRLGLRYTNHFTKFVSGTVCKYINKPMVLLTNCNNSNISFYVKDCNDPVKTVWAKYEETTVLLFMFYLYVKWGRIFFSRERQFTANNT